MMCEASIATGQLSVGQRDLLVMKQFSLTEIASTVVLLAIVVAKLLESPMLFKLTQPHFKLLTGAHLLLVEC